MAGAVAEMKHEWSAFKHDHAGERFQHHRQRMKKRSKAFKGVSLALGIVLMVTGAVFCVLPGPGLPLIIFGVALVGARAERFAKLLDRGEQRVRRWGRALVRRWHSLARGGKMGVIAAIVLLAVAGVTFMWHFVVSAYLLD